jgi:hypothetical protein
MRSNSFRGIKNRGVNVRFFLLAAATALNLQPFLAIQPAQLLVVHPDPFAFQHETDAPIAEPAALARQLADELYEGEAAPLLLAFARQQRFTPQELKELKGLIDSLAEQRSRKKSEK